MSEEIVSAIAEPAAQTEAQSVQPAPSENVSIFGESYSEMELMGEDVTAKEETDKADDQTEKATADEKDADGGREGENGKGDEAEQEDRKDGNKPPKGFVPNEALKAERQKRKEAQQRIAELERQLAEKAENVAKPMPTRGGVSMDGVAEDVKNFVNAHPEYAGLVLEKSADGEALREAIELYGDAESLWKARTVKMERELNAKREADERDESKRYGDTILGEMDKLFKDGSRTGKEASELVSYAKERGVSNETINLLTNPYTVLIDPSTGRKVQMGGKAYELVSFMQDAFQNSKTNDPDVLMAKLEPIVTDRIMKKMNGQSDTFRDLGSLAGHENAPARGKELTEGQIAKLSPEQLEAYLMGEY